MGATYSIGIDLGTTNSALSYKKIKGRAVTKVLELDQQIDAATLQAFSSLPSFLCKLDEYHQEEFGAKSGWSIGEHAKNAMTSSSGKVVYSAKSWLCHSLIDRSQKILPWNSEEVDSKDKLSPIEASSFYLKFLREAWDKWNEQEGLNAPFSEQKIILTVPASFDPVAQELTLEAAKLAGYPDTIALLEEPQAVFYRWIEAQRGDLDKLKNIRNILVCDIGGGTSDFSLFSVEEDLSTIKRIAVSDHLLLGGDNLDLAIAKYIEDKAELKEPLKSHQWVQLVAQSRSLKERLLVAGKKAKEDSIFVSIAGSGTSLFEGSKSIEVKDTQIREIIELGFYPECEASENPALNQSGIRDLGLPYVSDTAITKHLASFLGAKKVDAVLFNGGSLTPSFLKERLLAMLSRWMGHPVTCLRNTELDLAVARGASYYGFLNAKEKSLIDSSNARSLYIETFNRAKKREELVCIMPKGVAAESVQELKSLNLLARVNQPASFPLYCSFRDDDLGAVIAKDSKEVTALAPLQTIIQLPSGSKKPANNLLEINLQAKVNSLGLLKLYCASASSSIAIDEKWELHFNLEQGQACESEEQEPPVDQDQLDLARKAIGDVFSSKSPKLQASRLIKEIENKLSLDRGQWSLPFLRALWPALNQVITKRSYSIDHESSWLYLAGFALRPGYGAALDTEYINQLMRLDHLGLAFSKESKIKQQSWILWRRVAGGFNRDQQEVLLLKGLNLLKQKNEDPELIRMCASLERAPMKLREKLFEHCLKYARLTIKKNHNPYLWALGRLLSRVPLYAGQDAIFPETYVQKAWDTLKACPWNSQVHQLFSKAGKITNSRDVDLSKALLELIIAKMKNEKADNTLIAPLLSYIPVAEQDRVGLFGEKLPLGLVLVNSL